MLRKLNKKKIELTELQKHLKINDYEELYNKVLELISKEIISPIKSSGSNGKRPALYNRYTIVQKKEDYSNYIDEITYKLNIKLDKSCYLKNPEKYKEDRKYILMLNDFLNNKSHLLSTMISKNERSFQIWSEEKFLNKGANRILKNLGISQDFLSVYETTEPLAYYSNHKNTPQNILIIENKDTFYSFRRYMLQENNIILGQDISTLIYGSGKSIYKTFKDFEFCVEPYLLNKNNNLLYFGDLDYEGIVIYEGLSEEFKDKFNIKLFVNGYKYMIDKYINENIDLPITKEGQNKNIKDLFLGYFDEVYKSKIMDILQKNKYIPQEIINIEDL